MRYAGIYRVHGTLYIGSTPSPNRRVLLYDPKSMRPIAETLSANDGRYEFSNVKAGTYIVLGQDRTTQAQPDIVRVASEAM